MGEFQRRGFLTLLAGLAATAGCARMQRDRPGDGETVVSTRYGLEKAFEDLSSGETIYISPEGAPYRTHRWLDVNADVVVNRPGATIDVFVDDR